MSICGEEKKHTQNRAKTTRHSSKQAHKTANHPPKTAKTPVEIKG